MKSFINWLTYLRMAIKWVVLRQCRLFKLCSLAQEVCWQFAEDPRLGQRDKWLSTKWRSCKLLQIGYPSS